MVARWAVGRGNFHWGKEEQMWHFYYDLILFGTLIVQSLWTFPPFDPSLSPLTYKLHSRQNNHLFQCSSLVVPGQSPQQVAVVLQLLYSCCAWCLLVVAARKMRGRHLEVGRSHHHLAVEGGRSHPHLAVEGGRSHHPHLAVVGVRGIPVGSLEQFQSSCQSSLDPFPDCKSWNCWFYSGSLGICYIHAKISHLAATLSTSCARTACFKLSTNIEQLLNSCTYLDLVVIIRLVARLFQQVRAFLNSDTLEDTLKGVEKYDTPVSTYNTTPNVLSPRTICRLFILGINTASILQRQW
jgi:hypothetical protein